MFDYGWLIVGLAIIVICLAEHTGIEDPTLFSINWKSHHSLAADGVEQQQQQLGDKGFVHISSGLDEKYLCKLPEIKTSVPAASEGYVGATPGKLVQSMYAERVCSYWLDLYWTYELCHGRYVLQYHENRETLPIGRTEFYLGSYQREQSKTEEKNIDQFNPPKRKIENKNFAYFPVTYRQGTVCDLTGKPRQTTVLYICNEDAKDQIVSFAEVSSCTYELIVLTKRLCSHPSFQPLVKVHNEIVCYAKDAHQSQVKPRELILFEQEHEESREMEYNSKFIGERSYEIDEEEVVDDDDDADTTIIMPKRASQSNKRGKDAVSEENKYLISGKHCLYGGGTGWWKYELCYGKSVIQFHESLKEGRVEILLGLFNEELHKHWIDNNPKKKPLKIDGRVTQVTHLYAGGDKCEEIDAHRSVEVNIRCRPTEGSHSAVTLYLLEPNTCQYVLGVESERFCDLLQNVDEYGLIHEESNSKE